MTLNHLNLPVPDVDAAAGFFAEYFGMRLMEGKGRPGFVLIMEDDAGFTVVLSNFKQASEFVYPADFQVGFYVKTVEKVDALYGRLLAAGFSIEQPPRTMWDTWRFYFRALGTLTVEVSCPIKDDAVGAAAMRG